MDGGKLFSEVKFFMAQCNKPDEIKDILIDGGAKHINYLSEHVSHVVADSSCPEAEEAVDLFDKPVVSSLWVHLCVKAKRILPAEAFSPMKRIFQDVIAIFSNDLSRADTETLAATLTFYGGRLTKELSSATHFIVTSTNSHELQNRQDVSSSFKIVAPDWILESVKQKCCLDELLFDPSLLLSPPPPPPPPPRLPTPPPSTVVTDSKETTKNNNKGIGEASNRSRTFPANEENPRKIDIPHQSQNPSLSTQQRIQQQPNTMTQSHLPRPRMTANIIRGMQPRSRPVQPQNPNMPQPLRQQAHLQPCMVADTQQPRKVLLDYNHTYQKATPYQSGPDIQPIQPQQPVQTYQQVQYPSMHQQNVPMNQATRIPQPNVYQQTRPAYQNSHIPPRVGIAQTNMINQLPVQTQQINRFQDSNSQISQPRHYPVRMPQQTVNTSYQQASTHRQPVYYNQNANMPMRTPQQGPMMRGKVQNEPVIHDNYNQQMDTTQPHSQYQNPQQAYHPRHLIQPQQTQKSQQFQQPHPVVVQSRPQFSPNMPNASSTQSVRGMRNHMTNQQDTKLGIRNPGATQTSDKAPRAQRTPIIQAQPHPSIFDLKKESSYAQMKAKVPVLSDDIEYFAHPPGYKTPTDRPFINCRFMFVEYDNINIKLKQRWQEAIEAAGGVFLDNLEQLTHIICESRSIPIYAEAMKNRIRCVTIYWINDVLAADKMSYPWKALHIPTPFTREDKPLQNQIISITNLKGKERREVREMITRSGAKYTDYFSQSNTLLICGIPGGDKYERAMEWRISIANCQLLSDFLISGRDFSQMLAHAKYQNFNRGDQLKLDSYVLIRDLMNPWTKPIPAEINEKSSLVNGNLITNSSEDSGIATGGSNNSDTDAIKTHHVDSQSSNPKTETDIEILKKDSDCENKTVGNQSKQENGELSQNSDIYVLAQETLKDDTNIIECDIGVSTSNIDISMEPETNSLQIPVSKTTIESADEQPEDIGQIGTVQVGQSSTSIATGAQAMDKPLRTSEKPVRVLFTRLEPKLASQLTSYVLKLGLSLASSPIDCTHLVVQRISRSPKFICAFSHAEFILSLNWLLESHELGQVLDERPYILNDEEGEKRFSFNLRYSMLKRRKRKDLLFKNIVFFVTPTVFSGVPNMKEMIESAGGDIATRKLPTKAQISQMMMSGKRFVVVTDPQDIHLCSAVESSGVDIVGKEFVISGILRQDIDFQAHRVNLNQSATGSNNIPSSSLASRSSIKRLRIE